MSSSSTTQPSSSVDSQTKRDVVTFSHLVSVKLDKSNFLIWKHQIFSAIRGHDLHHFIDKSVKPPAHFLLNDDGSEGSRINPAYQNWEHQDQLLASWMSCSMSEAMLTRVVGCETSLQIWEKILNHFASQTRAKVRQLKSQLKNTKKGNLSANEYLLKIKAITDALAGIGHPLNESDHIEVIFEGLTEDYDQWITAITIRSDPYTVDEVESLLIAQEARIEKNHKVPVVETVTS